MWLVSSQDEGQRLEGEEFDEAYGVESPSVPKLHPLNQSRGQEPGREVAYFHYLLLQ